MEGDCWRRSDKVKHQNTPYLTKIQLHARPCGSVCFITVVRAASSQMALHPPPPWTFTKTHSKMSSFLRSTDMQKRWGKNYTPSAAIKKINIGIIISKYWYYFSLSWPLYLIWGHGEVAGAYSSCTLVKAGYPWLCHPKAPCKHLEVQYLAHGYISTALMESWHPPLVSPMFYP